MRIRYSTIDAHVHGSQQSVAMAKGQAIDLDIVIGRERRGEALVDVTLEEALGGMAADFPEEPSSPADMVEAAAVTEAAIAQDVAADAEVQTSALPGAAPGRKRKQQS